ncbi:hypothetical protein [Sphingosinicella rhizophila]|uniref:Lipoprotein n=1 Tax=Sphingosinicella rhizophila TaxID=3050082 RepID=A0ABU3Q8F7_9SPHN|nr:hypothetical protein [Sphingosinicella sp. GR2756]MDT9599684.1 hypothetical protein [Sphingosinicella sp. GR2756]
MRHFILAAAATLILSACAYQYEARIRNALTDAGLSREMAGCVAERMVDRLSGAQLRRLARVGQEKDRPDGELSVGEFLDRYRGALDPEIYKVIAGAGIGCAISI